MFQLYMYEAKNNETSLNRRRVLCKIDRRVKHKSKGHRQKTITRP